MLAASPLIHLDHAVDLVYKPEAGEETNCTWKRERGLKTENPEWRPARQRSDPRLSVHRDKSGWESTCAVAFETGKCPQQHKKKTYYVQILQSVSLKKKQKKKQITNLTNSMYVLRKQPVETN